MNKQQINLNDDSKTNINYKPKGTQDIFGKKKEVFLHIRDSFFQVANSFNFQYIETPIFEFANIFLSSGQSSDIVNKQMYEFKDKNDRLLALRPEGTAPAIRAINENKLYLEHNKFFYFGPMFRYERPQKGRNRQFYQAGIEYINLDSNLIKLEVLDFAKQLLTKLDLLKDTTLKINYLATQEQRNLYSDYLKKYLLNYKDQLSFISQTRLDVNPLRILDEKQDADKEFVKQAPKLQDFYTQEQKEEFEQIQRLLQQNNINFEVDPLLVRGLDYYDNLVFEFVSESKYLGTKSTILAGGCYNGLFTRFAGPDLKGIGFALGVDRIAEILINNDELFKEFFLDFFILALNEEEIANVTKLVSNLRFLNFRVDFNKKLFNSFAKAFKNSTKWKAKYLIFKEKNQPQDKWTIKNSQTLKNIEISEEDLKDKEILNKLEKLFN
ncbi:histidine--tRNA ligase [Mycoplasma hyorhinis]|uniref:histidine--tRNA ligase n=1 Tax=Mesomycoplasma hyorhinis TaxID=2100 RepID=UPI0013718637|nr:histidine--tRNA ligase [Mesomycoplasma hyorhinis]MXR08219.1 histidine--tRNA ligase [Mesomycoplasma hyorhinis]